MSPPPGIPLEPRGGGELGGESLRQLTLPALPKPGAEGASVAFGDWLTVVEPTMKDLATGWWTTTLKAATESYDQWLVAAPLQRLRLKPTLSSAEMLKYQRVDARGVSMLLASWWVSWRSLRMHLGRWVEVRWCSGLLRQDRILDLTNDHNFPA